MFWNIKMEIKLNRKFILFGIQHKKYSSNGRDGAILCRVIILQFLFTSLLMYFT
jgi:hypothetical protein